ncbi:hypothetical protein [Shimia sp. SDUM112013]|uniref:hypothetical protein n=1 Tax=Shimia sp. SDUM112013 TaxID=3136160 RepID=UPI0032EB4B6B
MVISILHGAPFWVWPVLALLVWLGLRATRVRSVASWSLYVLPLAGLLSLNAVHGLNVGVAVWAVFGGGYLSGALFGRRYQAGLVLEKSGGVVRLAGEWMTLLVLMIVFWVNFAGGVAQAIAPVVYASFGFKLGFAAIAGLAAGSFLGRAIAVLRA